MIKIIKSGQLFPRRVVTHDEAVAEMANGAVQAGAALPDPGPRFWCGCCRGRIPWRSAR